ncbi:recombination mediator protein UvsY [Enterobacter cloacae complex sp. 363J6]|uniref:recombination mediator protein UvsY n=1 Tax=Enterobacter cloacae complex sp. 363J6 TaxID=3395868 RepID=UPI003CEAB449
MAELKLEDLQTELEEDMHIDPLKLQSESADIPKIWSKWLRYHSNAKKKLIQLQAKKEAIVKDRLLYYTGRHETEMTDVIYTGSGEIKIAISGDPKIVEVNKLIQYFELIAEFTGKALDIIKNKGYSIKNMLEIRKLESGA